MLLPEAPTALPADKDLNLALALALEKGFQSLQGECKLELMPRAHNSSNWILNFCSCRFLGCYLWELHF